ncbi:MAG: DUF1343 domain-containing protein [Flavobacteriales bacterium]|nr:MAG: DUF1343 domain-containing protein [Flavobacteriales bacterium]
MKLNLLLYKSTFFLILIFNSNFCFSQSFNENFLGANRTELYLDDLIGKKVGIVGNHTSLIYNKGKYIHLVDSLLSTNIDVKKIFSPEHGFRGNADAGEKIGNNIDEKTGLEIISLYGSNRKPNTEQLKGLNILVFDIQDVGTRFYTYISTLHYVMEAAAENNIKLIVLDRPNPNGHYVDGPIRETELKSFVGMHPIPIVHGMTIGEYALMINGQGWLDNKLSCDLKIIKMKNYDRKIVYNTPLKPSPNLPNTKSINLYPSLCLFEGTNVSIGRGTNSQFQIIGNPDWKQYNFSFTPVSMPGAKFPKHKDVKCFGIDLKNTKRLSQINLKWILEAYNVTNNKEEFFSKGFDRLAGNYELRKQIKEGKTEKEIKLSWKEDIQKFKKVRSKYLLY